MNKDADIRPNESKDSRDLDNLKQNQTISENQVVDYLEKNLYFFDNHRKLVQRLYIEHEINGARAYSITQYQNQKLRDQITLLNENNEQLHHAFQSNCYAAHKFNNLIKQILKLQKVESIDYQLRKSLKNNFGYSNSKIYLIDSYFNKNKLFKNKNDLKSIQRYLNGSDVYLGPMQTEAINHLGLNGKKNSFVLLKLDYQLGFWLISHPSNDINKNRENTDLVDTLRSIVSYKIKHLSHL